MYNMQEGPLCCTRTGEGEISQFFSVWNSTLTTTKNYTLNYEVFKALNMNFKIVNFVCYDIFYSL